MMKGFELIPKADKEKMLAEAERALLGSIAEGSADVRCIDFGQDVFTPGELFEEVMNQTPLGLVFLQRYHIKNKWSGENNKSYIH